MMTWSEHCLILWYQASDAHYWRRLRHAMPLGTASPCMSESQQLIEIAGRYIALFLQHSKIDWILCHIFGSSATVKVRVSNCMLMKMNDCTEFNSGFLKLIIQMRCWRTRQSGHAVWPVWKISLRLANRPGKHVISYPGCGVVSRHDRTILWGCSQSTRQTETETETRQVYSTQHDNTDAWYQTPMTVLMYYWVLTWYQLLICKLGDLC